MRYGLDESDDSTDTEESISVVNGKTQTTPVADAYLVDSMASLRIPGAWPKSFVAAGSPPQRSHSNQQRSKSSFHRRHTLRHKSNSSRKRDSAVRHRKPPNKTQPKSTRDSPSKKATGSSAPRQPRPIHQHPTPNAPPPPSADTDYVRFKRQTEDMLAAADALAERFRARAQPPAIFDDHENARHKPSPPSAAKDSRAEHKGHYGHTTTAVPIRENVKCQEQARAARDCAAEAEARLRRLREERERIVRERERAEQEQVAERTRLEEARRHRTESWARQQHAAFLEHKRAILAQQRKLDPWTLYERAWKTISSLQNPPPTVRLGEIPWPIKRPPEHPHGDELPLWFLSLNNIRSFLLDPNHFACKSTKLRLREALLIWHPDKFESRLKGRVPQEEWERVFEGCQAVIRVLNDPKLVEGLE